MNRAEEVMEALRVPCMRRVSWFSGETATHLTIELSCAHVLVLEWPVHLTPRGYKKFLMDADVDCRECAP